MELLVWVGVQPFVPGNGTRSVGTSAGLAGEVRSCASSLLITFVFPGN